MQRADVQCRPDDRPGRTAILQVAQVCHGGDAAGCQDRHAGHLDDILDQVQVGALEPALTVGANQFLRPDTALVGNVKTGDGYTITYTPGTGVVTAAGACT